MKQPCRAIRELLGAYADHELRPAQAEQVESHLDTCVSCRRELGETQKLGRLAQSVTHPQLAEDYWDWLRTRVWRRLRERRREPIPRYRPSFLWAKLAAAGAGALVLLVVVISGWRMFERPALTGQNRV
ncbi:zf-HC2 domain-containing protein, partial [candidate division WOR-3 bacterium]|nr:zf-HC2 domain-containing protein [candidate division WOR-3 bacterium]